MNKFVVNQKPARIEVVDALRGFAILCIILVHNMEHFDFAYFPEYLPNWLKAIDQVIWDGIFFLFGGKAYSIFALLFGLTFFIQSNRQAQLGKDFSGRFAWRMLLLFLFSILNAAFYQGDILMLYAILALLLIPINRLNDRMVLWIAAFLMLQPYELGRFIYVLMHPGYELASPPSAAYFAQTHQHLAGDSLLALWKGNLTIGRMAVMNWYWENCRVFQTASLFLIGMWLGRNGKFYANEQNLAFWKKVLWISVVSFVPLYLLKTHAAAFLRDGLHEIFSLVVNSWANFAFTLVWVSLFVLVFQLSWGKTWLGKLVPFGKMSLSNYVIQSILGSFIYFGYGLGLYQYTGALMSILIGILMFIILRAFSVWYMSRHKHGPLESLWHKATWI